jgi:hypothetical protein
MVDPTVVGLTVPQHDMLWNCWIKILASAPLHGIQYNDATRNLEVELLRGHKIVTLDQIRQLHQEDLQEISRQQQWKIRGRLKLWNWIEDEVKVKTSFLIQSFLNQWITVPMLIFGFMGGNFYWHGGPS